MIKNTPNPVILRALKCDKLQNIRLNANMKISRSPNMENHQEKKINSYNENIFTASLKKCHVSHKGTKHKTKTHF